MGKLEEFQNKLNALISEIATVKKNITYYDVYNITDAVYDKNEFDAKINALVNNSSLVVNTAGPFASNEVMYYPGDIVLKNAAGDIIHINAQTSGTYYPKRIDSAKDGTGSYTIYYGYVKDTPEIESSKVAVDSAADAEPAQTISFSGLAAANPEQSAIYGIYEQFTGTEYHIPTGGSWVRPLLKFYLVDDSGTEEISLEYTLQIGTNEYIVSISQPIANLYIEVK